LRFFLADFAGTPSAADPLSPPRPALPGVPMTVAVSPRQRHAPSRAKPLARLALAAIAIARRTPATQPE